MNYPLFFAFIVVFSVLAGCSKEDNSLPIKLTTTEKLIRKKWSLTGFAIRADNKANYGLTKVQWQAMGVDFDNLVFRADGRYSSSSSASGTYTLKQDDTVLEFTNEPYLPVTFYDFSVSDFELSGKSPTMEVNPQKTSPNQSEQVIAFYGLRGLALFKEVDVSKVKTVQLIFTYTGV